MRIAYLIAWRGGRATGPYKKMAAQAAAWAGMGHDVGIFVTTSIEAAADWRLLQQHVAVEAASASVRSGITARRRTYRALSRWDPDVVYLRHGVFAPGLRKVVRHFPTVLEINGDEVTIARQTSALKGHWTALTRWLTLSAARGAVFMTNEQATAASFKRYALERIVIPNGIDLAATPLLPPTKAATPRLVLLGHPHSPWHGTDKLRILAQRHPQWQFDVIGPAASDVGGSPPANLQLHGEMPTERYLELLAQADVGFGSMAMHRIGANENPALKVREYLALGLAVIIGCHDPDFPGSAEPILELPNTNSNIVDHDSDIVEFVNAWRGKRVPRALIGHLDLAIKERLRIDFLAGFARRAGTDSLNDTMAP